MKINFKKSLTRAFDKRAPELSGEVYSVPVAKRPTVGNSKFTRRAALITALFVLLTAFTFSYAGAVSERRSDVSCIILDFSPEIQIVVKDGKVISVDALGDGAQSLVDEISAYAELGEPSGVICATVLAANRLNALKSACVLSLQAINNDNAAAARLLQELVSQIGDKLKTFGVELKTSTIDFDDYNKLAFDSGSPVDDLDDDLEWVLKADEL